jgi:hypothetical protein
MQELWLRHCWLPLNKNSVVTPASESHKGVTPALRPGVTPASRSYKVITPALRPGGTPALDSHKLVTPALQPEGTPVLEHRKPFHAAKSEYYIPRHFELKEDSTTTSVRNVSPI